MANELVERIKGELAAFNEKRKALIEELRKELPALFQPLFEQSKKITSFSWSQYTPYFNDGEECTFSVNGIEFNESEDGDDDFLRETVYKHIEDDWKETPNPNFDSEEKEIANGIEEIFASISDDFYKDLFGDHVSVTIKSDGTIEVEDHDHE